MKRTLATPRRPWKHRPDLANDSSSTSTNQWNSNSTVSSSYQSNSQNNDKNIERITKDQLKSRLTAKDLIGKKVVDSDGKDVGEIKDIGLASVLPDDMKKSSQNQGGQNNAIARAANEVGQLATRSTKDVNVFVSVGGFMGIGDDLVPIPAQQLKRDGDKFKVDMTRDHLKEIAKKKSDTRTASND